MLNALNTLLRAWLSAVFGMLLFTVIMFRQASFDYSVNLLTVGVVIVTVAIFVALHWRPHLTTPVVSILIAVAIMVCESKLGMDLKRVWIAWTLASAACAFILILQRRVLAKHR
jgi:uncharacterized membrane protein YhhN